MTNTIITSFLKYWGSTINLSLCECITVWIYHYVNVLLCESITMWMYHFTYCIWITFFSQLSQMWLKSLVVQTQNIECDLILYAQVKEFDSIVQLFLLSASCTLAAAGLWCLTSPQSLLQYSTTIPPQCVLYPGCGRFMMSHITTVTTTV